MDEVSAYNTVFTFSNIFYKVQTPSTVSYFYHKDMTMKNCDFHQKWKENLYKGKILVSYDRSDGVHIKVLQDGTEVMSLMESQDD